MGVGANVFGQAVSIFIQLASIPIFLSYWSAEQYGIWLMMSAIPAYFAIADFGMVTVAANKMTMLTARHELAEANTVFQSIFMLTVILALSIFAVVLFLTTSIEIPVLSSFDLVATLNILLAVILLNIFSGLFDALFRANGRYALGTYLINVGRIIEWLGAIVGLYMYQTILAVAIGCLIGRIIASTSLLITTRLIFKDYKWRWTNASISEVKKLLMPGLQYMAFPTGNAISLQGVSLIVGSLAGPAFLTTFSIYRTVSRVVIQLVGALSHSLAPEFSKYFGNREVYKLTHVFHLSAYIGVAIAGIGSVTLYILGPWFINLWTEGKVDFNEKLFFIFILYTFLGAVWHIPRILLLSTNNHKHLSYFFLVSTVGTIGFASLSNYNIYMPAIGMAASELGMLIISVYLAKNMLSKLCNDEKN